RSSCPRIVWTTFPVAASQTHAGTPSALAAATQFPSRETASLPNLRVVSAPPSCAFGRANRTSRRRPDARSTATTSPRSSVVR
ncbi:MAG TPA: hypothetical protein VKP10_07465, partial [Gemmatimonadales bacterium]|nr:hypothetical protein [Gemmatimonadales bacterium]